MRNTCKLMPRLAARSSPKRSAVNFQSSFESNATQIVVTTIMMIKLCHVALFKLPNSQNRICCETSGAEINCTNESKDWKIKSNAIPTNTSISELKRRLDANKKRIPEASIVMTNAPMGTATCTGKPKLPKAITTEAPKPAAAARPNV